MGNPFYQLKLPLLRKGEQVKPPFDIPDPPPKLVLPKGGSGTAEQLSAEERLIMMNLWREVYVAAMEKMGPGPPFSDQADWAVLKFKEKFFGVPK